MDSELNNLEADFNVRLDQWISKQGTLFQIKHAKGINSILPKLCIFAFKLLLLGILALGVFWFYLSSKPSTDGYRSMVQSNIKARFNASTVKVKSIQRVEKGIIDGEMKISTVELQESENTFFQDWYELDVEEDKSGRQREVENIRHLTVDGISISPFGITDGMFGSGWKANKVNISSLTCKLKAGAETDAQALKNYQQLFTTSSKFKVTSVNIEEANITWGYGVDTGSIRGAQIKAQYVNGVLELDITRGKFSHNWLKDTDIIRMKLNCHEDGKIEMTSAELMLGDGKISLSATVQVGAKPEVNGTYSFAGINILHFVGIYYEKWLSGKIKGEGAISGNMNSAKGLKTVTEIMLNNTRISKTMPPSDKKLTGTELAQIREDSRIFLRGSFSLFEDVLQYKDAIHSYSLLNFDTGSFTVTQQGNDTSFKVPDIRVGSFLILEGDFTYNTVKLSETEERNKSRASDQQPQSSTSPATGGALTYAGEEDTVDEFAGKLRLGFLPQVFQKHPEILKVFPMDTETARVWIPIEMKGGLNDLSSEIAEKLDKIIQEEENKRK